MNNKGDVLILIPAIGLVLCLTALPFMTPKFRINKAIGKCNATEEVGTDCKAKVALMTKTEVLDYIKDR